METRPRPATIVLAKIREEGQAFVRALRPHLVPISVLSLLFLILYLGTLRWLLNAWQFNPYYGHGLLVPPMALFFMWRARHKVAAEEAAPARVTNLWGVGIAAVLYGAGMHLRDPFLFSLSLVAAIGGILLYVLGPRKMRHLVLPLAFLLLAIPIPDLLYVGVYLQVFATWGTDLLLTGLGLSPVRHDFLLTVGGQSFDVAPLCSGLSGVLSIIAVATAFAALSPLGTWSRLGLVAIAIPFMLVANVARITLIIGISLKWGVEAGQGVLHGLSDLVLFLVAIAGVILVQILLVRLERRGAPA